MALREQNPDPREYGLPHTEWRPGQWEAVEHLLTKLDGSITLLQAPTGSGKTGICRAVAARYPTTSLVHTKALQQENYGATYGFDVLFGRGNYECVHPSAMPEARADQCLYENRMTTCERAGECPYLLQKSVVQESGVRSLNIAYFLTAKWVRSDAHKTRYGFFDEAHTLPEHTLNFAGCTVRKPDQIRWHLPEFPPCYVSTRENVMQSLQWLERAIGTLSVEVDGIRDLDPQSASRKSRGERLLAKLKITAASIHRDADNWYVRSGERALEYDGHPSPGLMVKPLTARYHFPRYFLGVFPRTVLMSATLGNHADFADELGIEAYEYESVPNQWPPSSRTVHILDVPTLGHSAKEDVYDIQAQRIAKVLGELPRDWSGVIHVTSWRQASDIVHQLILKGVDPQRLFVPERSGTNVQMQQWNAVKSRKKGKGMIVVTPSMDKGVDLLDERICIVAKVPWPYVPPGSYEHERMLYSNRFYRWQTASGIEQRCGRTRRGRPEDYDTPAETRGYVAIADGAFRKMGLAKACSKDFVSSLVYE